MPLERELFAILMNTTSRSASSREADLAAGSVV